MKRHHIMLGSLAVLGGLLAGCGSTSTTKTAGALDAREARQREAAELILRAAAKNHAATKVAFALAAADQSNADLLKTIAAIDNAREVVQTNLRNIGTIAYKRQTARIIDGEYAQVVREFETGKLENTGRQLDVAIQGDGFFEVRINERGDVGYTRQGNFYLNQERLLVAGPPSGESRRYWPCISVPGGTTEVSISPTGDVFVRLTGHQSRLCIGRMTLVRFFTPQALKLSSDGIYLIEKPEDCSPVRCNPGEDGTGQLLQGFLESSNVDLVRERARLKFLDDWRAVLIAALGLKEPTELRR